MKKIVLIFVVHTLVMQAEKLGYGHEVPLDLIKSVLPRNPVIVEAGAHYGQDTSWMAETWPQGVIHAFEPTPVNFDRVCQVARAYHNIRTYAYALDYECNTKLFYQDDGGDAGNQGANSLLPHKILEKSSNPPITVTCLTLDAWAAQTNVDHIDFMWLDVEGNELNVLKAALNILPTVRAIFTEVNFQEFWHGAVQYHTLKAWLEEQGFTEVWQDVRPDWNGNVLFVRQPCH